MALSPSERQQMAKRGRPKSDRPKFDTGTPELILKRATAAPTDPTLSTSPIDILKARKLISDEAHSAAVYFNALRKLVFGKAHPAAIDLTAVSQGGMPEELDLADAERKYRDACATMRGYSRHALDAVENLVVHERPAPWMFTGRGRRDRAQNQFMAGLAALLGWYRGRQRKAA